MQREDLKITPDGIRLLAYINCDIDSHTSGRLRERVDREIFIMKPRCLVLDFSKVGFMDSSGLALILGRVRLMESLGGSVSVVGLSEHNMKLLRLSGIERIKSLSLKN